MALDYASIQDALTDLLSAGLAPRKVFQEGMAVEIQNLAHMPLVNIRLIESVSELTSIPDGYYEKMNFALDVIAFSLSSYREAARLRDDLIKATKTLIEANPRFHTDLQTSTLVGSTVFGAYGAEGQAGHVAMATITVVSEAYNQAA